MSNDYRADSVQALYESGFRGLIVTGVGEVEARDDRIADLERRNGELEKLRVVASKMANSLYNWKQQDWAATRSEKMDALVLEHDTLTRSLRAAPTQHQQGESDEQR